jgi:hypothetical protein
MTMELVPHPLAAGGALPTTAAADLVSAWLDGRCQNTQRAYVREIRNFANGGAEVFGTAVR